MAFCFTLAPCRRWAFGAMNTIESVEARIQDLRREVVRLKVARNALAPSGRIPPDVLLDTAQGTMQDRNGHVSKEVCVLTFVCSRTRSVPCRHPGAVEEDRLPQERTVGRSLCGTRRADSTPLCLRPRQSGADLRQNPEATPSSIAGRGDFSVSSRPAWSSAMMATSISL